MKMRALMRGKQCPVVVMLMFVVVVVVVERVLMIVRGAREARLMMTSVRGTGASVRMGWASKVEEMTLLTTGGRFGPGREEVS